MPFLISAKMRMLFHFECAVRRSSNGSKMHFAALSVGGRCLYSLCKNSSLAEDLLQETFLKALLSLPDDHTNMRAWLYLVARNLFFNYYRREKEKVPLGEVQQIQNTASQEVLEGILKEEKNRLLYQAMNELEERKREILLMQYFGGLSQKEIAAILKMTPENVRVLSYRAKRELRTYMEDHNYDLS